MAKLYKLFYGAVTYLFYTTVHITANVESDYLYKEVFRSLPNAAVIVSPELMVLDASNAYYQLTQYKPEHILNKSILQLANELTGDSSFHDDMERSFRRVLAEKQSDSYDFVDLNHRMWYVEVHPVFHSAELQTSDTHLALMLCQVTDRTELYDEQRLNGNLLEKLQHSDNYRRLVNSIHSYAIFMVDDYGVIRHWNEGAALMTGYSESEAIGQYIYYFFNTEDHARIHNTMQAPNSGSRTQENPVQLLEATTFLRNDGTSFPADATITPIYFSHEYKRQIGHAFIVRDLTSHLASQAELKRAYEEAANLKNDFTSRCSHDLRTPLNAISLACDALYATAMTAEQTEFVFLIKRSVKKMLVHVNEILDYYKLTAPGRKLSFHLESTNLVEFLKTEINDFRLIAPSNIEVEFFYPDSLPCYMVDQNKLQQIVANLVSNALKFTSQGSVSLTLKVASTQSSEGGKGDVDCVEFHFNDTGQGISPEGLKTLFVPYTQIDGSNTQRNRGSGLGLSIVKIVVQGMGGTVEMTSGGIGYGTQVLVKLPLARAPTRPILTRQPTSAMDIGVVGDGLQNIIVAEDDDVNRKLLVRGLNRVGYTNVDEAKDGQELINKVCPNHNYQLVITDVSMPYASGIDATKQIRVHDPNVPIVGLTADGTAKNSQLCESAGMNKVIVKPIRIKTLASLISKILS